VLSLLRRSRREGGLDVSIGVVVLGIWQSSGVLRLVIENEEKDMWTKRQVIMGAHRYLKMRTQPVGRAVLVRSMLLV
jgi:hypothetical protein